MLVATNFGRIQGMPLIEFAHGVLVPKHVTHVTIAKNSYRSGWTIQVHFVSGASMQETLPDEAKAKYRFEQVKKHLKNYAG